MLRFVWRTTIVALLAACLFFYGCTLKTPETIVSANLDATPAPIAQVTPSPTPRVGNPVWLFYSDFYTVAQEQMDSLHDALAQSEDPSAIDGELLLSALEEHLSEGMVSFGLLMGADDGSAQVYASDVEGAATGNGTITGKNGQYNLSFTYAQNSATLSGSLSPYRLRYSRQVPEQESPTYSLLLLRAKPGWAAVLNLNDGSSYVLRLAKGEVGLYVTSNDTPPPITFSNCIRGATRSWEYVNGELTMRGPK